MNVHLQHGRLPFFVVLIEPVDWHYGQYKNGIVINIIYEYIECAFISHILYIDFDQQIN